MRGSRVAQNNQPTSIAFFTCAIESGNKKAKTNKSVIRR